MGLEQNTSFEIEIQRDESEFCGLTDSDNGYACHSLCDGDYSHFREDCGCRYGIVIVLPRKPRKLFLLTIDSQLNIMYV